MRALPNTASGQIYAVDRSNTLSSMEVIMLAKWHREKLLAASYRKEDAAYITLSITNLLLHILSQSSTQDAIWPTIILLCILSFKCVLNFILKLISRILEHIEKMKHMDCNWKLSKDQRKQISFPSSNRTTGKSTQQGVHTRLAQTLQKRSDRRGRSSNK